MTEGIPIKRASGLEGFHFISKTKLTCKSEVKHI